MNNKDLIKQYIDTGLELPEYQIEKLSNNDKKTYIRKRLIGSDFDNLVSYVDFSNSISPYEVSLLDDERQKKYYQSYINDFNTVATAINYKLFNKMPEYVQKKCIAKFTARESNIPEKLFFELSVEEQKDFLKWNANRPIGKNSIASIFYKLPYDLKQFYVKCLFEFHGNDVLKAENIKWKIASHNDFKWQDFMKVVDDEIANGTIKTA